MRIATALIVLTCLPPAASQAQAPAKLTTSQAEALFTEKLYPLLHSRCFGCHGDDPKDIRAGLDLRSLKSTLRGGESGTTTLVPGHPAKSLLIDAISWKGPKMPPKEKDRLSKEQVEWVRDWIAAGAPWPESIAKKSDWAGPKDGVVVKTSGGLSDDWTNRRYAPADLWAFKPLQNVKPPADGAHHPIDAFLNAKLGAVGLKPAARAERRTLIRRLTFDLTGLPPTTEAVESFVANADPTAYEKLVDRLLSSAQYGEQMARHWLDVVRYADSSGFSNDFERPHAWRYRDYVVRAFQKDKPFGRFILEQIAGDELADGGDEGMIAAGYLRMGPWEHTGMSVAAVTRQFFLDDVTNAVGETFLGLPLSCCRCHDHKFDPLPTRDYYRLQAVFAPVQFADRDVPFLKAENLARFDDDVKRLESLLRDADSVTPVFPPAASAKLKDEITQAVNKVRKKRDDFLRRELQRTKPLAQSVYNGPLLVRNSNLAYQPLPKALKGELQTVSILAGGSLESPGPRVEAEALSVLGGFNPSLEKLRVIPKEQDGRRLALARWIASPDNPLTPRVLVNRLWQMHFGTGLVATPNNFGKMGKQPSHPELLDWLARQFVERGWSIKAVHRLIVTSEAYQRDGRPVDAKQADKLDADNRLLSYLPMRRLAAEEIRDSMLALTGELNLEQGGIPMRPELHAEVAFQPRHVMGTVAPAYQPSRTPAERNRRSIYAVRLRTLRNPLLEVFDQPGTDLSCERRTASTVTPQSFTLLNSDFSNARALELAQRLEKEKKGLEEQVDRAFELVFGRLPAKTERNAALSHVARLTKLHAGRKIEPAPPPKVIVREFVEEEIGVKFRWQERLDVFEDYVADVRPWEASAETRALANLCLVLFNANEFLYVP